MVHIYELSLPSVEQLISSEFDVGPEYTGPLGTAWRLPFGLGALLAGWLADRFGSKRLLLVYLVGCVGTATAAWASTTLAMLFVAMFAMGTFASIYHPAGLALISHHTTPANRGLALGYHGIIGSIGIATAPLMAGAILAGGVVSWRGYYLMLAAAGVVLAVTMAATLPSDDLRHQAASGGTSHVTLERQPGRWRAYALLVTSGTLFGFVYAALVHFLPRYLNTSAEYGNAEAVGISNYQSGMVLLCGAVGQYLAGRLARPARLERLLLAIFQLQVPTLALMALAEGRWRLPAACLVALVHFMNQPIYNSLIAQYVPAHRRSVGYGFSNLLGFGIGGSLGPAVTGWMQDAISPSTAHLWTYALLSVVTQLAAVLALVLWRREGE